MTAAATVDQALALIDAQVFDAAMLDMNLNGNKSHAVADALAARGVPFVFSTGYSGQDMRDGYRDRPVLKKPFRYRNWSRSLHACSPSHRVPLRLSSRHHEGRQIGSVRALAATFTRSASGPVNVARPDARYRARQQGGFLGFITPAKNLLGNRVFARAQLSSCEITLKLLIASVFQPQSSRSVASSASQDDALTGSPHPSQYRSRPMGFVEWLGLYRQAHQSPCPERADTDDWPCHQHCCPNLVNATPTAPRASCPSLIGCFAS